MSIRHTLRQEVFERQAGEVGGDILDQNEDLTNEKRALGLLTNQRTRTEPMTRPPPSRESRSGIPVEVSSCEVNREGLTNEKRALGVLTNQRPVLRSLDHH